MRKAKIVGIKKIGKKNTVDIEVNSNEHAFYADGFVVSNSHAVAYAVNAYTSGWYKANHTKEFFLSWLHFSSEKQDPQKEISELVAEAKLFDIKINVPNIDIFDKKFFIKNGIIYFGIKDIKSLSGVTGDNVISTIKNTESELEKSSSEFSWMDILIYLSPKINSTAFKALCAVGFFCNSSTSISRNTAIYEYLIFQRLTKTELEWVKSNYATKKWASLLECFTDLAPTKKNGGGTSREDRSQVIYNEIHFLKNPPYCLDDSPLWIITEEAKILGCPISLSSIESSDISFANTSCKEIINGKTGESLCVAGNIKRLSVCKVKKGKTKGETMCFVTIEDDTCSVDNLVIFPVTYKEYEFVLYEGNNLLFCGKISKNGDSFIVDKIHEI